MSNPPPPTAAASAGVTQPNAPAMTVPTMVTSAIAMPPPRGVGTECELR
jgi:hypothetical protein